MVFRADVQAKGKTAGKRVTNFYQVVYLHFTRKIDE